MDETKQTERGDTNAPFDLIERVKETIMEKKKATKRGPWDEKPRGEGLDYDGGGGAQKPITAVALGAGKWHGVTSMHGFNGASRWRSGLGN